MASRADQGPVAAFAARTFRALSAARGKRVVHPDGVGFTATLTPLGPATGGSALDQPGEAVVRLSRSLGVPEPLPDLLGVAVRVTGAHGPGRHQDLLLISSARPPLARHSLLPSRGFCDRPYSTVLPYRLAGKLVLIGARALGEERPGPGLGELRRRTAAGLELELELSLAEPRGEWSPVARLSLGARLDDKRTEALDMDPTNTGGGLELAGALNRLRGPSYRASQTGRGLG